MVVCVYSLKKVRSVCIISFSLLVVGRSPAAWVLAVEEVFGFTIARGDCNTFEVSKGITQA